MVLVIGIVGAVGFSMEGFFIGAAMKEIAASLT